MPALVAGLHVLKRFKNKDVGGRDEPGHDGGEAAVMGQWAFYGPMFHVKHFSLVVILGLVPAIPIGRALCAEPDRRAKPAMTMEEVAWALEAPDVSRETFSRSRRFSLNAPPPTWPSIESRLGGSSG
jgi:hypothetical protein